MHRHAQTDRGANTGDFFHNNSGADGIQGGSAEFPRHLQAEIIQRPHFLDDFTGKSCSAVYCGRNRRKFRLCKRSHGIANQFMLGAGIQLQCSLLEENALHK